MDWQVYFQTNLSMTGIDGFASEFPSLRDANNGLINDVNEGLEAMLRSAESTGNPIKKEVLLQHSGVLGESIRLYLLECALYGVLLSRIYPNNPEKGYREIRSSFSFLISAVLTPIEGGHVISTRVYYKISQNELGRKIGTLAQEIFSGTVSYNMDRISHLLAEKSAGNLEGSMGFIWTAGLAVMRAGYHTGFQTENRYGSYD